MTLPKPDRLQDLSRDELIALILPLIERVRQLEAEVAALKSKTPPTSQNSSLPPARDWKSGWVSRFCITFSRQRRE